MIYGVIDIGSNSIRLSVFKVVDGIVYNLFNDKTMAGLAGYVEDEKLNEEGIQVLIETLNYEKSIVKNFENIDRVFAFATASLRNISNSKEVMQRVKIETGFMIELIKGKEEALLSFIGAAQSVDADHGVLTDIGGGSTEVVVFKDCEILESESMDIGSLNLYTRFVDRLLPTKSERSTMNTYIKNRLSALPIPRECHELLCVVGGSGRATLKLYNEIYKKDRNNSIIIVEDISKMIKYMERLGFRKSMDLMLKVKSDRVHTLIPGMLLLNRVAKYFHSELISVSKTGVREGYLYKRVLGRDI